VWPSRLPICIGADAGAVALQVREGVGQRLAARAQQVCTGGRDLGVQPALQRLRARDRPAVVGGDALQAAVAGRRAAAREPQVVALVEAPRRRVAVGGGGAAGVVGRQVGGAVAAGRRRRCASARRRRSSSRTRLRAGGARLALAACATTSSTAALAQAGALQGLDALDGLQPPARLGLVGLRQPLPAGPHAVAVEALGGRLVGGQPGGPARPPAAA
jgi:hypothetical protein